MEERLEKKTETEIPPKSEDNVPAKPENVAPAGKGIDMTPEGKTGVPPEAEPKTPQDAEDGTSSKGEAGTPKKTGIGGPKKGNGGHPHWWMAIIKWFFSAFLAGVIPTELSKLFGKSMSTLDSCGFYFGLTGSEMVYELVAEPSNGFRTETIDLKLKMTSIVILLMFIWTFVALNIRNDYSEGYLKFVRFLGFASIIFTCIKKGYREEKQYVSSC